MRKARWIAVVVCTIAAATATAIAWAQSDREVMGCKQRCDMDLIDCRNACQSNMNIAACVDMCIMKHRSCTAKCQ